MARLGRLDRAILVFLVPLWALCFGLCVYNYFAGRLVEPRILLSRAASESDPSSAWLVCSTPMAGLRAP